MEASIKRMNRSILEAPASGVPVIQPDHGAYPKWIDATQGGLIHRSEDSADLAEKLATLLRACVNNSGNRDDSVSSRSFPPSACVRDVGCFPKAVKARSTF